MQVRALLPAPEKKAPFVCLQKALFFGGFHSERKNTTEEIYKTIDKSVFLVL